MKIKKATKPLRRLLQGQELSRAGQSLDGMPYDDLRKLRSALLDLAWLAGRANELRR